LELRHAMSKAQWAAWEKVEFFSCNLIYDNPQQLL
jgi:hypothetical protein